MRRGSKWLARVLAGLVLAQPTLTIAAPSKAEQPAPELTKAPTLVTFVEAEYPQSERASGRAATVTMRLSIAADGKVSEAEVVGSAGAAFDEAALTAAKQFVFTPAELDGVPAAIRIEYAYQFELKEEAVAPTTAAFSGVVVKRGAKTPLANVTVELVDADDPTQTRSATTDASGRFAFDDVPAGAVTVRLAGEGLTAMQVGEQLTAGEQLDVSYEVAVAEPKAASDDEDDLEIVVVAPTVRREVVSTKMKAEEARKVPGTSGDVVRVVESMPGVARSTAGAGQLIVWGASPQDTRVYLDGVPIPRLYHEGGLRSVVHPKLVDGVELVPGGYQAPYGRGLGGLVSVTTLTPEGARVGGRVQADFLDASGVIATPLDRKQKLHFAAAVRGSYVQAWSRELFGARATAFVPIPSYGDGQVRLLGKPSTRDRIELVVLGSADRFTRGVPNVDPALSIHDRRGTDFGRAYVRWTHQGRNDSELTVTPFFGWSRTRTASSYGPVETSLGNTTWLAGVRANQAVRPAKWAQLDVGIDAELDVVDLDRKGALALPAREGDIRVFGQPPPDQIGGDRWRATMVGVAPYAQVEFSPWNGKLRIVPGIRLDPYARATDRRNAPSATTPKVGAFHHDFAAEPRLAVAITPHERVGIRGAVGLYRQSPAPEDLSAVFGNPSLPTSRALHTVAGIDVKIVKTLSLGVTGFFTRSKQLAMRSDAESPLPARALEPSGSGRAYGMQVLLRQELWKGLFGWVAYTVMRSQRRDRDGEDWRLFDYDQTHVLTAVLAWALPRGFEVGARMRYASGFPRTPVTGAYFNSTHNRWQPTFGKHNSIRIPAFVQLDLRVAKRWDIAKSKLEIFVEVLNLWNRRNAEELIYSPDYTRRGRISGFPVLPVAGLQWDF
ncbi:MAG TPA: TonB-dependent receptor [Nannocystaceae bacterium]|nr:TonB-dependent receptor [Nannocystaceae bacterium]